MHPYVVSIMQSVYLVLFSDFYSEANDMETPYDYSESLSISHYNHRVKLLGRMFFILETPVERSDAGVVSCDMTCSILVKYWCSSPSFVVENRAGLRSRDTCTLFLSKLPQLGTPAA
jgi:hypothetical protein